MRFGANQESVGEKHPIKKVIFYAALLVFISHSILNLSEIMRFRQPTLHWTKPFFLTFAQNTLLFDRHQFFFEKKIYVVRHKNSVTTLSHNTLRKTIPYLDALMFSHNVYGRPPSILKNALLKYYFCEKEVHKLSQPALEGKPISVEWFIESEFPYEKFLFQSVECA